MELRYHGYIFLMSISDASDGLLKLKLLLSFDYLRLLFKIFGCVFLGLKFALLLSQTQFVQPVFSFFALGFHFFYKTDSGFHL